MTSSAADPVQRSLWLRDVDGLAFAVRASVRAADDRPPFVLVHGIGVSHRYLALLHDVLAEHRSVCAIDLPGFGGLPKPPRDVDVGEMAAALGVVVESLGVGPVVLIGHSMGSQWVIELAAQRPELASDVVAMGPVADARHRSVLAQSAALALDTLGEGPAINLVVFTDYVRCGPRWYLTQLRHMLAYRPEDRVAALRCPLLIIRGERDPIAGLGWCRLLRDHAPRATVVGIPGQFHVAQQSRPRAIASAILAHVSPCGQGQNPRISHTTSEAASRFRGNAGRTRDRRVPGG